MNITTEQLHHLFLKSSGVCTDTRKIEKNCIFFALKGENFDANSFAKEAINKGALYVIIDNQEYFVSSEQYILVNNTLTALQELAQFHRNYLKIPIIALTGSNGKTTTKELINAVLSTKFKTVATSGNLNNHIGVPLTLLSMDESTQIGIVEMGANHFGEIALLSSIAQPNYGYITNFGKAHLEGFGSLEGVVKAKSELYQFLANSNGIVFVNQDDAQQMRLTENQNRILNEKILINEKTDTEYLSVSYQEITINTHLVGNYNTANIAAALSIGLYFGIDISLMKNAIEAFTPDNKRSQLIDKQYCKIILDAYNANPTSMEAALLNFSKNDVQNKIVILGDMFELGTESEAEHQHIVTLAEKYFNEIIVIGRRFYFVKSHKAVKYKTVEDFQANIDTKKFQHKTILIKASRGMALERLLAWF